MGWLSILLMILQALPTIFKLIEMLRDALKDRSLAEKAAYKNRLGGILKRWREHRDVKRATAELQECLDELSKKA